MSIVIVELHGDLNDRFVINMLSYSIETLTK